MLNSAKRTINIVFVLMLLSILSIGTQIVPSEDVPSVTSGPATTKTSYLIYLPLVTRPGEPPKLPTQGLYDSCVGYLGDCMNHLDLFASRGFKLVLNYGTFWDQSRSLIAYANRAQSLGMKIIWSTQYSREMGTDDAYLIETYEDLARESGCKDNSCFVRYVINLVKNHPATWGYYVADEVDPAEHDNMKYYSDLIKSTDPNHPRLYVVSGSYEMEQYFTFPSSLADLTDAYGPDIYPYGFLVPGDEFTDLTGMIADHTDYWSNKLNLKGVAVLQAFNGVRYNCFTPPCTFPTYEQMKDQRDQVIQYSQPEMILWWTFDDILKEGSDWQKHWDDLASAAFAPLPSGVSNGVSPSGTCLSGWTCEDIGNPQKDGSQSFTGNIWTVSGAGWDISLERNVMADQFRFIWQNVSTDRSIDVKVASQTSTNSRAQAGLMFRKTFDPTSPYYAVGLSPNATIKIHYRSDFFRRTVQVASKVTSFPAYIRISRTDTTYRAYSSDDGITWSLIPYSTVTIDGLEGPLMAGMVVTSGNKNALNTAVFEDFESTP